MKKWLNKVLRALVKRVKEEEDNTTGVEFIDLLGEII